MSNKKTKIIDITYQNDKEYKKFRSKLLLNENTPNINTMVGVDIDEIEIYLRTLSDQDKIYFFDKLEFEIKQYIKPIISCNSLKKKLNLMTVNVLIDFNIIQHEIICLCKNTNLPLQMKEWKLLGGFYDYFIKKNRGYQGIAPSINDFIKMRIEIKTNEWYTNTHLKEIIENSYYNNQEWEQNFYIQNLNNADIGQPVNAPDFTNMEDIKNWRKKMVDYLFIK